MNRFVRIHFLNLLDGSRRLEPPNIVWELPREGIRVSVEDLAITDYRIMMHVRYWDVTGEVRRILVWDWKTGDLVRLLWLEYSYSPHLASSGVYPLTRVWEHTGYRRHQGHLPR